ncbi:MAG: hypothetical protein KIH89_000350 [Candidatus Shapirobacteria bacterium]|nr:hypothetical protein [Candidatus Shapirobacteria bacterium]
MKHELRYHLLASLVIFVLVSIFLVIGKVDSIQLLYLFLGITLGSFILDIDHFIFWFFLKPNLEESRLARTAIQNYDFKAIYSLLKTSHQTHYNLIFHHYFFQVILVLFSFFIFTLTKNLFITSLVVSLNLHLLIDEIIDFVYTPKTLQKWLFARENSQLPVKFLGRYILVFSSFLLIFIILLIATQL